MNLLKPRDVHETQPATYGAKAGEHDTYYAVHVYAFNDDESSGDIVTADTLSELRYQVSAMRKHVLVRSRPNGWDDKEAFQVGRPTKYHVTYV